MRTTAKVMVLGGGMIGMLAKWLVPDALVLDWKRTPPRQVGPIGHARQFGAQYLWEPLPDIPCKKIRILTTVDGEPATLARVQAYKRKIGKDGDLINWEAQFRHENHGYVIEYLPRFPEDYARFNVHIAAIDLESRTMRARSGEVFEYHTLISCIPLPSLMQMCGYSGTERSRYRSTPICIKASVLTQEMGHLPPDTYRVNYVTDPLSAVYRVTDREGMRHAEYLKHSDPALNPAILPTKVIVPGKIWPVDTSEWVIERLNGHRVFPFGRFPCWRPDELVHQSFHNLKQLAKSL